MASQPSKHLKFETERPPPQGPSASASTSTSSSSAPPSAHAGPSSIRRPSHLQQHGSNPQTPPRPILITPTSPTAPAASLQTPVSRARTHNLPDEFLASLRQTPQRDNAVASTSSAPDADLGQTIFQPAAPQFAEQLSTPRRRPRRSRIVPELVLPQTDQDGFYDETEGDLYRGPGPSSPRPTPNRRFRYDTSGRELDEDAVTLRSVSSKTSSSSSSTDASVMSRSRRKVVGALRGLGVLGSEYSRSSSESSSDEEQAVGGTDLQRRKSFSRKLKRARRKKRGRAWSFGRSSTTGSSSSSSDDEPLGRRKVTGRREFVLLVPPPPARDPPLPTFLSPSSPPSTASRIVRTPYLPDVLKEITNFRNIAAPPPPPPPPTRAQSRAHVPQHPTSLRASSRPTTPVPMTPRQLLNASFLPAVPSQSHDPAQRRPPVPVSQAGAKRFLPPSIPMPIASLHAPFPSSPAPSPPVSGTSTPTSYFQAGGALPRVTIEGPTPSGTPLPEDRPKPPSKDSTKAWWLDINCPTWEDMRSIGELFSLHPLTLEDILHQDPREKLETFDSLGYYLITFRAVDESYFKYTDEPSSTGSPSILSPDIPPVDPSLGPTNPDLPGNPSKEPVLITSTGGVTRGGPVNKTGKGRRRGKVEIQEDRPGKEGLEGVGVGAVNVYLVVFRDGIISFHFDDISKHTQGVMDRLLSLEDGRTLSSDWIAHGLMDSIVDSFFPLIDYVEFEADDIDGKIVHHDELVDYQDRPAPDPTPFSAPPGYELQDKAASQTSSDLARLKLGRDSDSFSNDENENEPSNAYEMKTFRPRPPPASSQPRAPRHLVPPALLILFYTFLSRFLLFVQLHPSQVHARRQRHRLKDPHRRFRTTHDFDRGKMLKRMTDTRRLITGLSRLLIPKSEVVGRLKKRAEEVAGRRGGHDRMGLVGGEMVTYIGDVQDHILSMQSTLLHAEQILAQAQPAYVSQLRVSAAVARGITDSSILKLSVVTIGILPMQFVSGIFAMNVEVPHNGDREHKIPGAPNNLFGIIVAIVAVVACGVVMSVRHMKQEAFNRRKALEGGAIA